LFNDFGPVAVRYFRDDNHNRRLDGKEYLSGEMFHTTPDNEAQAARGQPTDRPGAITRLHPSQTAGYDDAERHERIQAGHQPGDPQVFGTLQAMNARSDSIIRCGRRWCAIAGVVLAGTMTTHFEAAGGPITPASGPR